MWRLWWKKYKWSRLILVLCYHHSTSSYWSPAIPWHVLRPWPDSILSQALSFSLQLHVWPSTWLVRNKEVIHIYVKTKKVHSLCLLTKFSVTFKPTNWMDMVPYETCTCETLILVIQDHTNDHKLPICWFMQLHYSAQHVVP